MPLYYLHAGSMVAGFVFITVGAGIARFYRHRRWWLKAHKIFGTTGSFFMLPGLIAAFLMVDQDSSGHIRIPHAWSGLIMIFLAFVTPALGQLQFEITARAKQLREKHRWSGRIAFIVCLVTILSGARSAGII